MLQCVVLSRPIILPHVGNSPCDKFDWYQVYLHHFHVPCIAAVLSYYGEIDVPSKLSTPRLLGDSVLWGHIPLQWAGHYLVSDWVISFFCRLRLLKKLLDLVSYFTVQSWFFLLMLTLSGCKFELDICPALHVLFSTLLISKFLAHLILLFLWYYRYTHCSGLRHAFKVRTTTIIVSRLFRLLWLYVSYYVHGLWEISARSFKMLLWLIDRIRQFAHIV